MVSNARKRLWELLDSPSIIVAPGVYDGISARIIEDMGFETAAITGAGVANSRLGSSDFGILNLSENTAQARMIADTVDIPVQADADTGYGNAVNVYHTVKTLEDAGVAAIMIEDQQWPKRCGHMEGKSVISMKEMCNKIEAAVSARDETDPKLVIKARTDSAATHGVDEAIRRLNAYVDRGADMVYADALLEKDDIRRVCREVDAPVATNMGYGIRKRPTTPLMTATELEDLGIALVSYPRLITGAAAQGMYDGLSALKQSIESDEIVRRPDLTLGFEEYTDLMGLPELQELEARFAKDEDTD